jgi:hypothetical protein
MVRSIKQNINFQRRGVAICHRIVYTITQRRGVVKFTILRTVNNRTNNCIVQKLTVHLFKKKLDYGNKRNEY